DRVAGLILVNPAGFTAPTVLSRLSCRLLGNPEVGRRLLPLLVPSYMKARNPHDRAIAERVQARARTADGARVAASLWRCFGAPGFGLRAAGPPPPPPTLLAWGAPGTLPPVPAGPHTPAASHGSPLPALDPR